MKKLTADEVCHVDSRIKWSCDCTAICMPTDNGASFEKRVPCVHSMHSGGAILKTLEGC